MDDLNIKPWRDFGDLMQSIFPFKVQKISVHAGFSCPNLDGSKSWNGCSYCSNQAFSPEYESNGKPVIQQLNNSIRFFSRKYPEMRYLAYFQSHTNTYGPVDVVLEKFNEALKHPGVVGLVVATRPDCMPDELLDELEKIASERFLLIEYGIQSTNNDTLRRINRGHTYEEAVETIRRTHARGIRCGAHLILGLPGESRVQILSHADRISQLPITTVKLHQLQLINNTKMAQQILTHPELFRLHGVEEYINLCIDFLSRLNPEIYVDRFISHFPEDQLVFPSWGLKNHEFVEKLHQRIQENLPLV
jgi:radical SAM protein (TIGR01212 family)